MSEHCPRPGRTVRHIAAALLAVLTNGYAHGQQDTIPETTTQKYSYAIAVEVARRFRDQGMVVDEIMALRGLRDGAAGTLAIPESDVHKLLNSLQAQTRQRNALDRRVLAIRNQRESEGVLDSNQRAPAITQIADGIQVKIVQTGENAPPAPSEKVHVSYVSRLPDGRELDRIGSRDSPELVTVSRLIPGLQAVIPKMPVGSRWIVWIAPEQAYGPAGNGEKIGPNQLILFEIERHGKSK